MILSRAVKKLTVSGKGVAGGVARRTAALACIFFLGQLSVSTSQAQVPINEFNEAGFDPDLRVNSTALGGAGGPIAVQPDGQILITGNFSYVDDYGRTNIARLHVDGSLDPTFGGVGGGVGGPDGQHALQVHADGKILVAAYLAQVPIVRLYTPDGSIVYSRNMDGTASAALFQPDGKVVLGGEFTQFSGQPQPRIVRLNTDGSLDAGFDPGTGADAAIKAVALQADGKLLVGGDFTHFDGQVSNRIARLNADGSLDTGFNPGTGADGAVNALAVQVDSKVLIGGDFITINHSIRPRITRLNADGSLDADFNTGSGPNAGVHSIVLQPDGKVLIGGVFVGVDGVVRERIAQLNGDGTLDAGFSLHQAGEDPRTFGLGPNGPVDHMVLHPDGRLLITGAFTVVNNVPRRGIARLNRDGSLDQGGTPPLPRLSGVRQQADGKSLIATDDGRPIFGGIPRPSGLARINIDGSLDIGFEPGVPTLPWGDTITVAIRPTPDGKYLAFGAIAAWDQIPRTCLVRLNADGSLDDDFVDPFVRAAPGTTGWISIQDVIVQPTDGKIIVVNSFMDGGPQFVDGSRFLLARLNPDGSKDSSFQPLASSGLAVILGASLLPGGKILVYGQFDELNGEPRYSIARLNLDGSLDTGFAPLVETENPDPVWGHLHVFAVPQPDNKILITGDFTQVNGEHSVEFARLNPDGSLDSGFLPNVLPAPVGEMPRVGNLKLQADGKIVAQTALGNTIDGVVLPLNHDGSDLYGVGTVRFHPDGVLDIGFHRSEYVPGTEGLEIRVDGQLWRLAGANGIFGRQYADAAALQELVLGVDSASVAWLRGGMSPEVVATTFEVSLDGISYVPLGTGVPVLDGDGFGVADAAAGSVGVLKPNYVSMGESK